MNNKETRTPLLGMDMQELKEVAAGAGLPAFAARQMFGWIYQKNAADVQDMTNISQKARNLLAESHTIGLMPAVEAQRSVDGTAKYLFPTLSGHTVESVFIPDKERGTLCVSCQVGCRMGCKFCMTGRQGFHGHMSAADIISQFLAVDESDRLTNAVFMGMGEPLDNYENVMRAIEILTADWGFAWSPKRITVSTIGVLPNLKRYLDECRCHLAVSLHDPFGPERLSVMPVQGAWPIQDVIDLIRQYDFTGQRRVSFEYTMFAGFNDTKAHADALIRMLRGLECRMNLIRFHKIPDFPYETSAPVIIENFKQRLNNGGLVTTVRASRGEDILAACGMLAGQHKK